MTTPCTNRRWFQLSLRSLFLLTLLVATFFARYSLAEHRAEASLRAADDRRIRAERELSEVRVELEKEIGWRRYQLVPPADIP